MGCGLSNIIVLVRLNSLDVGVTDLHTDLEVHVVCFAEARSPLSVVVRPGVVLKGPGVLFNVVVHSGLLVWCDSPIE